MMKSNYNINNQPKNIIYCKKCVYSNQKVVPSKIVEDDIEHSNRIFLRFGMDGICSACKAIEKKFTKKKNKIDWKQREAELKKILEKYRSRNGSYDCIVPGSGGKDSVFQAHMLKNKYNMNPLTVTFAPAIYTDVGMSNFHKWSQNGNVNNLLFSPAGRIYGKLVRLAFENMLHPFQPFIFGQRHYATHLACKFKIPLIFLGEPFSEFGSEEEYEDKQYFMPIKYFTKKKKQKIKLAGVELNQLIKNEKFKISDLEYFLPLDQSLVKKNKIQILFFGYFENMMPQENFYKATEITDFKTSSERTEGTYSKYNSLDDKIDGFHYWTSYIKFGIGRTTEEASNECRHGYITREEAVNLVKKYDGEFPKRYFQDFLKFTDLSAEQFYDIVDSFRPAHLWKKNGSNNYKFGSNWELKYPVFK